MPVESLTTSVPWAPKFKCAILVSPGWLPCTVGLAGMQGTSAYVDPASWEVVVQFDGGVFGDAWKPENIQVGASCCSSLPCCWPARLHDCTASLLYITALGLQTKDTCADLPEHLIRVLLDPSGHDIQPCHNRGLLLGGRGHQLSWLAGEHRGLCVCSLCLTRHPDLQKAGAGRGCKAALRQGCTLFEQLTSRPTPGDCSSPASPPHCLARIANSALSPHITCPSHHGPAPCTVAGPQRQHCRGCQHRLGTHVDTGGVSQKVRQVQKSHTGERGHAWSSFADEAQKVSRE